MLQNEKCAQFVVAEGFSVAKLNLDLLIIGLYDMASRVKPRNEQLTQTIDMICVPWPNDLTWPFAHPKVNASLKKCNVQKLIERSCIQSIFHKNINFLRIGLC